MPELVFNFNLLLLHGHQAKVSLFSGYNLITLFVEIKSQRL